MRLHLLLILLCLFLAVTLGACVSAEEQRAAEATTIAASIFATQTAEAPTITPTHTPSPVPTDTPLPTPTDTPTPAPTPTWTPEPSPTSPPEPTAAPEPTAIPIVLPEGWIDYAGDGFHIALPEDWQVINVDEVGFDAIMETLDQFDADWADNIKALTSSEAMRETTRLFAISTDVAGLGLANVIVQHQELPIPLDSRALARQFEAVYEQLGVGVEETEAGLEINGLDALRITVVIPVGPLTMEQVQYILVDGRELWVIGMTVDQQAAGELGAVFDEIAGTFRVGQ